MTYRELWQSLSPVCGGSEARAVADYVLDVRFGLSKADVLCGAMERMNPSDAAELGRIFSRLRQGEPVQYVLGRAEFGGRWFGVRPGVLIPRPETEELCAMITADCKGREGLRVLDVGTGSGCIAVTLALDIPRSSVTAYDISPEALAVARGNALRLKAAVTFERRDALCLEPEADGWDVIVSNPPYICNKERKDMAANVLDYEPEQALFVPDDDPLRFYAPITRYAAKSLRPGGALYFELNPLYADYVACMARREGFAGVAIVNDCYGKRRMIKLEIKS